MPIYEYWCNSCGKEFEQMRPMSQAGEPATCPTCGASAEKLPSVFASKADYTIKVPSGGAFRQRPGATTGGAGGAAGAAGAEGATTQTES
jgi:putative FmdB family regulatory protein